MEYIIKPEWEEIWSKLPFENFNQEELTKKIGDWKKYAQIMIEKFSKKENFGLVASTAAGKTIMAILAIIGMNPRVIFLAPRRILVNQHIELLQKISGGKIPARAITGETTTLERKWNEISERFIFATPHVFLEEMRKGRINLHGFDLVVFDEMHRAAGNYPYISLAREMSGLGTLICGLSASPGGNLEKIERLKKNLFLESFLEAAIETPKKIESFVEVELDEILLEMDALFSAMLVEILHKINEFGKELGIAVETNAPLPMRRFENIERILISYDRYEGSYLAAKYRKLYHAYYNALTEDYETLKKYMEKLEKEAPLKKSSREIVSDERMKKIFALATGKMHPKKEKLIDLLSSLKRMGKNALVFFYQKNTIEAVYGLTKFYFRCDKIFGGKDRNLKHQKEVLEKLANRQIDFLFATSVAEEGISIPEIDFVIHYSMPPTEIALLQRSGRTGRVKTGNIIFLALNHKMDKIMYFATKAKVNKMKAEMKELSRENHFVFPEKNLKKPRKKKRDELTLPLF